MTCKPHCQPEAAPKRKHSFVQKFTDRHGCVRCYFRRVGYPRVALPAAPESADFVLAYNAAMKMVPGPNIPPPHKALIHKSVRIGVSRARLRAKAIGVEFNISKEWALGRIEDHGYRCELTGVRYYSKEKEKSTYHPYAPSLDRIDCSKGYTKDNVRIILASVNLMLSDWGTPVFEAVSAAYRAKTRKVNPLPAHPLSRRAA